jgi:hypothetical protein
VITNSVLNNLNYGSEVHSLTSSNQHINAYGKNKAIIMNLHRFHGPVELKGNVIKNNHIFIPSAILSNQLDMISSKNIVDVTLDRKESAKIHD